MVDGGVAALFVGREKECAQLEHLVTNGHFALVCGPEGIGKSVLVQVVLTHREVWAHHCLEGDTLRDLGRALLEALGEEAPTCGDEELATYVLERAEKSGGTMLVEDLHHLSVGSAVRWCELVARNSRASTWVFTSRERIRLPAIQDQIIELGPLSKAELKELARRCGLRNAPVQAGAPFWIKQLAAAQDAAGTADASAFLDELSPESLRQLAMLSLVRRPGAEHGNQHAHELPFESSAPLDEAHEALSAFAESPSAKLDALRGRLEHREIAQAKLLLQDYEGWIHDGLGPRLWSLFAAEHDPALAVDKMRIAVDVGSRASLDWLAEQPAPAGRPARLDWAEGLLRSGRTRRALGVLRAEAAEEPSPRARLLLGQALYESGEAQQSVRVLRSIEVADEELALRRDSKLARALYHADQGDEAKQLLRSLEQRSAGLSNGILKAELSVERSALRLELGLKKDDSSVEAAPSLGSIGRVFQGIRLAASGRFRHSAEVIAALRSIDLPASTTVLAGVVQGLLRVTRGRYDGLSQVAREMVHETERLGNASLYHWSFMLERMVNLGSAAEHPELAWAPNIPAPTGIPQRYLQSLRVSHRARLGETISADDLPRAAPDDGPLVMCVCDLTEATVRLLAGDADRAHILAAAVTQRTARLGYFFFEGEALLIQCYAQLGLGRGSGLSSAVESLEKLSVSLRSKRYASIARLLRLSLLDRPDCSVLLALRQASDASPTAARVARTLMGAEPSGDALDALLVDSLRSYWTHDIDAMNGTSAQDAGWSFDPEMKTIALPDREVPISPLALRLLNCLFDASRDGVSLSRMSKVVWGIDEYHQLRDSKRVHVAVRRLRTILEEEPSSPTRLVTVDDGYALSVLDAPARLVPRT